MVLMRLLEPSLTRVEGGHDDANKPYVLSGELLPGQFARFQQYARYVRIVDALYDRVDFTVFVHLSHLNHGRPILPALQNLTWLRTSVTTPELPFIVPRYLRTLVLMLDEVAAPLIESLFVSISSELTPLLDLSPISAFKFLRSLDLGAWSFLDFHFLQQLSCMQNLSFLRAGALNIAPASGAIPAIGEFQALESLSLYSDVHQSTTLFSIISFPVLRMVKFIAMRQPSAYKIVAYS
ncbi:hypothetical protein A0H81_09461 [Grifola frondosa]|uniref:Uncharacterized protein n=1 Tax=Grifola frondosa TaxID=5627 RepID=A0A1C7M0S0_GRIFR|nr:hypothetical protein A0H81_09461 [Grifola frondosa]